MHLLKLPLILLIISLTFISCQDDPTSLGKDLISGQLDIITLSSDADSLAQYSSSFVADSISYGSADRILLGNLDYVKSTMLMRFGTIFADSIVSSLEEGTLTVLKSEVELRPIYKIGDKTQLLSFEVHKITSDWGSAGFNDDSLSMVTYDPMDLSDSKEITDSLIKFNVDPTVALEWMNALRGDSLSENYGMIFLPTPGTNLLYGFRAFPYVSGDDSPFMKLILQNADMKIDTVFTPVIFDVHLPQGVIPVATEDKLQLTAGLGQRGKLFFDLSKLPLDININRAELTLQVDSLESVIGSPDVNALIVNFFSDSTDNLVDYDFLGSRLDFDGELFRGEITRFVQSIVSGGENKGFYLTLDNEISAVDKYVIYGSKYSDRTLRPKLVIYYNVFD